MEIKMRLKITLYNSRGELDSLKLQLNDDDDPSEVSNAIIDELAAWLLTVGDTIKITEV
jgi:hypothetical protein